MFINLNTHSFYSILSSAVSIDEIINFAINNNQEYVSLIDINNMFGVMEFYLKAKANNLKPVVGIQINYRNDNVLLIAKNYNGYISLSKISSKIMTNANFELKELVNNDIIVVSNNINDEAFENIINKFEYKSIACQEVFFAKKEDYSAFKAIVALKENITYNQVKNDKDIMTKYFLSHELAHEKYTKEQLTNLNNLINLIDLQIVLGKQNHFIKFDERYNSRVLLADRCRQGLIERFNSDKVNKVYIDRLKYELNVIDQMGFNDYFLVVQDYVAFAKENEILVGAGRGSAAGSLVSYVLGITNIDPIVNNLIFERFLNIERKSMPDIDIDFMDKRRGEVFDYIFTKYTKSKVAHIITFQKIKAKTAIRDIGRILEFDLKIINLICKNIPFELEFDLKTAIKENIQLNDLYEKYKQLFDLAFFMIGLPRQIGTHAAGIVICNKNLEELVPICMTADDQIATQYSMEYLEQNGLIKMDILGLVNLSIIFDCLQLIYKNQNKLINLNDIPLDDKKVFDSLTNGKTTGIFQLESPGMRQLIIKMRPKSIEDISITSALFRPGPQKNIPLYLQNRLNPVQITYVNDDLIPILKDTSGIIVYQEQIIQIVCKVANYSLAQADLFRRAISKKDFDKLDALKEDFIKCAVKNNYRKEDVEQIFEYILKFANYGFNHSHSLAYSYISYQMAFLKTHYSLEFYCCLLSYNDNNLTKIIPYVHEAKNSSINVLPPDINYSIAEFIIHKKAILFGLNAIKGIGFETIKKIIECRQRQTDNKFSDMNQALRSLITSGIGEKTIDSLIKAGCFDELIIQQNKTRTYYIINLNEICASAKTYSEKFGYLKEPQLQEAKENNDIQESQQQLEILGFSFKKHPIIDVKERNNFKLPLLSIESLNKLAINANGYLLAFVTSVKRIKTKNNVPMAFVTLEDETGSVDAVTFNNILNDERQNNLLEKSKIILTKIAKTERSIKILEIIKEVN